MGGSSDPSVLRSPEATLQKGRAAHGPRHPAVIIPLRLCLLDVCLLLGVSWVFVWLLVWVPWSSGLKCCLVWCPLRSAPCLLDVCVPSLFLLFGTFADDVFFLSFSLSGAGETQTPCGVWVSPCVSSSWTRTPTSIRTLSSSPSPRSCPAPVFFFFSLSSSLAGMVVFGLGLSGLGVSVLRLVGWFLCCCLSCSIACQTPLR